MSLNSNATLSCNQTIGLPFYIIFFYRELKLKSQVCFVILGPVWSYPRGQEPFLGVSEHPLLSMDGSIFSLVWTF